MILLSYDISGNGHDYVKKALLAKGYREVFPNSPLPVPESPSAPINIGILFKDLRRVGNALIDFEDFTIQEATDGETPVDARLPNTTLVHDDRPSSLAIPDLYDALDQYNASQEEDDWGHLRAVFHAEIVKPFFWGKDTP